MAKKLTTRYLDTLTAGATKAKHYDAVTPGLFVVPSGAGTGKWVFGFTSPTTKKRREAGLGTYPIVTLAQARTKAQDMARTVRDGADPIQAREAALAAALAAQTAEKPLTFAQAACTVHEELRPGWRNSKHAAQWLATLKQYVFPHMGDKPLAEITPKDCADALRPIWLSVPETAVRTRQRMHAVMQWAWAHGHITANPVAVVDHLLPKQNTRKDHQPAMPWRDLPAFLQTHVTLRLASDTTRAALELLILTAARSGEVRAATWDEIDLSAGVWTVPAHRMKAKAPHRVPLASQAVDTLTRLRATGLHDELVFPSLRGKVLSDMTLTSTLRRVEAQSTTPGRTATAHGFRSSFRDWCSEHAYPRDLAERALAHTISNKVEAAYHRTDLLEQRAPMMQRWADFLFGPTVAA